MDRDEFSGMMEHETLIAGKCPYCRASEVYRDNTKILTSYPPQQQYKCKACGEVWSALNDREAIRPTYSYSVTASDYPSPSYGQTGWICPKCGKVLAPWMSECDCYRKMTAPAATKSETGTAPSTGGSIAISSRDSATSTVDSNLGWIELRG